MAAPSLTQVGQRGLGGMQQGRGAGHFQFLNTGTVMEEIPSFMWARAAGEGRKDEPWVLNLVHFLNYRVRALVVDCVEGTRVEESCSPEGAGRHRIHTDFELNFRIFEIFEFRINESGHSCRRELHTDPGEEEHGEGAAAKVMLARARARAHTHTQARTHARRHARTHARARTHTRTHTFAHTCTHTRTHTLALYFPLTHTLIPG